MTDIIVFCDIIPFRFDKKKKTSMNEWLDVGLAVKRPSGR